jgi:murein DD-endopeptidase MepM/ murein hydrolase activator NlpD
MEPALGGLVSSAFDESDTQLSVSRDPEPDPPSGGSDAPDSTRMLRDKVQSHTRVVATAAGAQPSAEELTPPPKSSSKPAPRRDAARFGLEIRSDGRSFYLPAPVGWVMAGAVVMIALLAAVDPRELGLAAVERQTAALARWEQVERAREQRALAGIEVPLRELRLEALRRGLAPEGPLAPTPCTGLASSHLEQHALEMARLSFAISASASGGAPPDALRPSRSPIDLTRGEFALAPDRHLPGTVRVSSSRGPRTDPLDGTAKDHKGLDISAPAGTPVIATADGTVVFSGAFEPAADHLRSLLGTHVIVEHGETGFVTLYAHLSKADVATGAVVRAGEVLGAVGSTGRSTGAHLHYQVMRGGASLDPLLFIADVVLIEDGEAIRWRKNP